MTLLQEYKTYDGAFYGSHLQLDVEQITVQ